jgi:hypothetical protein
MQRVAFQDEEEAMSEGQQEVLGRRIKFEVDMLANDGQMED